MGEALQMNKANTTYQYIHIPDFALSFKKIMIKNWSHLICRKNILKLPKSVALYKIDFIGFNF
jgi:hypothetical protein